MAKAKQKYYNHDVRPEKVYEINDGPILVDVSGYVDTFTQVQRLMLAGELLVAQRREEYYDATGDVDFDAIQLDPTRSPGYDLADAHDSLVKQKARLEEAKRLREKSYGVDPQNDEAIVDSRKEVNISIEDKEVKVSEGEV